MAAAMSGSWRTDCVGDEAVGEVLRSAPSARHTRMSDAYDSVVGGGLKLKGIGKKKKKKEKSEEAQAAAAAVAAAAAEADAAASAAVAATAASSSSSTSFGHTGAEQRRLETMRDRQLKKLEKGEVKSHRDQVKDFNSYLSKLTEHYDLPKVSKGN